MIFLFFKKKESKLNEEAKFKLALELCEKVIAYCELTIRDEILKKAANTGNARDYAQSIKNFQEAYNLVSGKSYLLTKATLELYAKRDIFLNLQTLLIGDDLKDLNTIKSYETENKKTEINRAFNSKDHEKNEKENLINQLIMRTTDGKINSTNKLKEKITNFKNNITADKQTISTRFKNANAYINEPETQKIINQIRDTSEMDGWFFGAIKSLVRIFKKESKSFEKINEIKKCIS